MEIVVIYLKSQTHRIVSLDKTRGMLSHAYMLECSDTYILEHFAMLIAKEIFCEAEQTPCLNCNNCIKVEHSNMVDLKICPKDGKSIVVEDINEIVSDSIQRPMDGQFKVYILNNFDKATVQAQNKLLKTLEEPPMNVIFILTCSNSGNVLPTIQSRVKSITENLLDVETLAEFLTGMKIKDSQSVASVSGGSIATALKLSSGDTKKIVELAFECLLELRSSADILKFSSKILALKKDFVFFVDTLISILRDVAVCGTGKINFKDRNIEIESLKKIYSADAIRSITSVLCQIYGKLEFNCNLTGVVDRMLLDILEVKFLCLK